jgi:hypothetical protein
LVGPSQAASALDLRLDFFFLLLADEGLHSDFWAGASDGAA